MHRCLLEGIRLVRIRTRRKKRAHRICRSGGRRLPKRRAFAKAAHRVDLRLCIEKKDGRRRMTPVCCPMERRRLPEIGLVDLRSSLEQERRDLRIAETGSDGE